MKNNINKFNWGWKYFQTHEFKPTTKDIIAKLDSLIAEIEKQNKSIKEFNLKLIESIKNLK